MPLTPTRRSIVSTVPGIRRRSTSYSSSSSEATDDDDDDDEDDDDADGDDAHDAVVGQGGIHSGNTDVGDDENDDDDYESSSTARFMAIQKRMLATCSMRPVTSTRSRSIPVAPVNANPHDVRDHSRSSDVSSVSDGSVAMKNVKEHPLTNLDVNTVTRSHVDDFESYFGEFEPKTPQAIGGKRHIFTYAPTLKYM